MPPIQQWNHNNHYHNYLLGQLPVGVERALDVGCGQGFFAARLAQMAAHVDAVDVDRAILDEAIRLHSSVANVNFHLGDFVALQWPSNYYDIVTSIASLHHMDPHKALEEMKRVLRPGGCLAILGLYRGGTIVDLAISAVALPADLIQKHILHRSDGAQLGMTAPTLDPPHSLAQINQMATAILPGARIRRHLFWRYSLLWRKPIQPVD